MILINLTILIQSLILFYFACQLVKEEREGQKTKEEMGRLKFKLLGEEEKLLEKDKIRQVFSKKLEKFLSLQFFEFKKEAKLLTSRGVKEAYQAMIKEINEEKGKRRQKLDEEIVLIIEEVAKDVLGRSFSLQEHEELIFKALEKAKKRGVFSHAR
ncbi:hypothetical protein ISS42_00015 [Candidatus Shapirobacteria bacterium]|nr:hypothetical protein [Candidatus Shapirobacteria bacterium]